MKKKSSIGILTVAAFCLFFINTSAQILTSQDSANAGIISNGKTTEISAYGEAKVQYDFRFNTAIANLTRNVVYGEHQFNNMISLFAGVEVDNAKSFAVQQCFLKCNINSNNYLVAGLFTPRIGIINENSIPTTFNGNDRPFVEALIIPSTWREIGIGFYGSCKSTPFYYSIGIVNGLNAQGFSMQNGIGGNGLYEGTNASATNIALTGSLLYYIGHLRIQASGYYGGSVGLNKQQADSLQLDYGPFGSPVALGEFDVQYLTKAFTFKALGTMVSIPEADTINRAYDNNVPQQMIGAYAELGVNLAYLINNNTARNFTVFARYEYVNMDAKTSAEGISDPTRQLKYIIAGITYMPIKGVAFKADYVFRQSGPPNPLLLAEFAQPGQYYTANGYLNIGIAYSIN
ncbi:MAG TPA: hypothetical protein VK783_03715 [Bacteroidia bacterium]|nr:hypothetical protein [Bacteroidia bacterium]